MSFPAWPSKSYYSYAELFNQKSGCPSHQQAKGEKPYVYVSAGKGWGCSAVVDSSPGLHRALFYPQHHRQGGKRQHRKSIWWNHDYNSETPGKRKALEHGEVLPADPDGLTVRKLVPLLRLRSLSARFLVTKPGVKPRFSYEFLKCRDNYLPSKGFLLSKRVLSP